MNRPPLLLPTGRLRPLTIAVAALVLVGAVVASTITWATALPDDVAVRVGDRDVTVAELGRRVDVLSAIYGVQAPEGGKDLQEFQQAAAKSIATSTVIEQAARRRDVVIATKTLQDELTKIIEQQNGDRSSFVAFLGEKGLKESDVIDELRRSRQAERLLVEVTKDVPVATKADAAKEYEERRDEIRTPEQRRLANIVVETQEEAAAVVQRLEGGDDFGDVASSTSLDASTSEQGGDLGRVVAQRELEPAYGQAAFAAKKGAVFGPVQTQSGWNVGTVLEVTGGQQLSYDEVEDTLLAAITSRRQQKAWLTWLNRQVEAADVEYADRYRPDDPSISTDDDTGVETK